jgi:hypothetical protein
MMAINALFAAVRIGANRQLATNPFAARRAKANWIIAINAPLTALATASNRQREINALFAALRINANRQLATKPFTARRITAA